MGEFKIWIYVILGVIWVVSRLIKKGAEARKKVEEQRSQPAQETTPATTARPRQLSFEELLREISQSKQPEQKPVQPKQTYVDYDDDLKEEEQDLEEVEPVYKRDQRSNQVYEDAKKLAFNRPSLEETMKVEDTNIKFSKFKVFEEEQRRNLLEEYTRDLQDPEGFKKALVLSEILNRRF